MVTDSFFASKWGHLALTAGIALLWMSVSSGLILLNKHILSDLGFRYPLFLCGLGVCFTSVASFMTCKVFKVIEAKQEISLFFYVTRMLPVGFLMAMTLALGNVIYLYLSVAFIQMLKAFTPVVTMTVAFMAGLERPSVRLIAAVFLIAFGVAIASYGEVQLVWLGVVFAFLSELTESLRLIMTQILLQGYKFSAIEGLMYLQPACMVWLFVGSYVLEYDSMVNEGAFELMASSPLIFMMAAAMGFMVNLFAYLLIKLGSALALKVLGTVKNALVVWAGVLLFAETVTGLQLGGYALSIFGFFLYNHIKLKDMSKTVQVQHLKDLKATDDEDDEEAAAPLLDGKDTSPVKTAQAGP